MGLHFYFQAERFEALLFRLIIAKVYGKGDVIQSCTLGINLNGSVEQAEYLRMAPVPVDDLQQHGGPKLSKDFETQYVLVKALHHLQILDSQCHFPKTLDYYTHGTDPSTPIVLRLRIQQSAESVT